MPRPRTAPIFELGGYWIGREKGKRAFYAYWHDAGTGHSRRRSLGCTNLEDAKKKLAEIVVKGDTKSPDALVSAVLLAYFEARTDKLPSKPQSRSAGRTLLKAWGNNIRIRELTDDKQQEFVQWCVSQGFGLAYAGRVLTVLKSALRRDVKLRSDATPDCGGADRCRSYLCVFGRCEDRRPV